MKKILCFAVLAVLLLLPAAALENTAQNVSLTYDAASGVIRAELSVTAGDAIVGHFGMKYNTEKVHVVRADGEAIPNPVPEKNAAGKSYLCDVVQPLADYIVITPEANKAQELIRSANGVLLFGWYATKDVEAVGPEATGGPIAAFYFKMNDGVSASDLSASDFAAVEPADCAGVSGWSSGVIVINSASKVFSSSPASDTTQLVTTVTADFSGGSSVQPTAPSEPSEPDEPTEPSKPDESGLPIAPVIPQNPDEPTGGEATDKDVVPTGTSERVDFALSARVLTGKVRFTWVKPSNYRIYGYCLTLKDTAGNIMTIMDGIADITRSVTVTAPAPDFEFTAELTAYTTDGTLLVNTAQPLAVRTARYTEGEPVSFEVTYDPGLGEMYGFESERVLFGDSPTKAPRIYAPGGYVFRGWSIDGAETVALDKLRIYDDLALTALYEIKP